MKTCEVCGQNSFSHIFSKQNYNYEKCNNCSLIRINPQPTELELAAIYQNQYSDNWGSEDDFYKVKAKGFIDLLTPLKLKPEYPFQGAILDVGASSGIFMDVLKDNQFYPVGIEISTEDCQKISSRFSKEQIINRSYLELDVDSLPIVDYIFMCDSFEHMQDPNKALDISYKLLSKSPNPNKGICIHIPNTNSFFAKLFGHSWEFYCSEHLFYFNNKNLTQLIEKHGFQVEEIKTGYKYVSIDLMKNILSKKLKNGPLSYLLPILKIIPKKLSLIPIKLCYGELTCYAKLKDPK